MPVISLPVCSECGASAEQLVQFERAFEAFTAFTGSSRSEHTLTVPSIGSCGSLSERIIDLVETSPIPRGTAALAMILAQARAISFDDYENVVEQIVTGAEVGRISPRMLFGALGAHRNPRGSSTLLDEGSESFKVLATRSEGLARRMVPFLSKWFAQCDSVLDLQGSWRVAAGLFLAVSPAELKVTIDRCIDEMVDNCRLSVGVKGLRFSFGVQGIANSILQIKGYGRALPYIEVLREARERLAGRSGAWFFTTATVPGTLEEALKRLKTSTGGLNPPWSSLKYNDRGMVRGRRLKEGSEALALSKREMRSLFTPHASVLDIGFGLGHYLWDICTEYPVGSAVGTDQDHECCMVADELSRNPDNHARLISRRPPRYCGVEGVRLPFHKDEFTFVGSIFGVPYYSRSLDEVQLAISEMIRVSRPGATIRLGPWSRHESPAPTFSGISQRTTDMLDSFGLPWRFLWSTSRSIHDASKIDHDRVLDIRVPEESM